MVMYGFSRLPSIKVMVMVGFGIIGFAGFVMFELRLDNPLLNLRLFRNRTFAFSNLTAFINYSANFTVGFLMSLYLHYIKGPDPQSAGLILVAQPVVMAVFAPIVGRLSETDIIAGSGFQPITRLLNKVYRIWVLLFLMAMAAAFFVPMMTTSFFPRVTPV